MLPIEFVYVCNCDNDVCNKVIPRFESNKLIFESEEILNFGSLNSVTVNDDSYWTICETCTRNKNGICSGSLRCVSQTIEQL